MNLLSLFSGAGGLDLGLEAAGFEVAGCVERDPDCRRTLALRDDWALHDVGDVEVIPPVEILSSFGIAQGDLTLLAGGPPCQPFSKSGQWVNGAPGRMNDPRAKTLVAYLRILESALPEVMLLENVKGLAASPKPGTPEAHALEVLSYELSAINERHGTAYQPQVLHLNAADFGVPQHRERIFVVAHRNGRKLGGLQPTHGPRPEMQGGKRWTTAWDAIGEFDEIDPGLAPSGKWAELLPSIPEGQNYLFHTERGGGEPLFGWRTRYWSFLLKLAKDRPSWTLQAQPGPATGPFHWKSRKLSVREMARLQTFPDDHRFVGSYQSVRKQIGNAVPAALAEAIGRAVRTDLLDDAPEQPPTMVPSQRNDCPEAEVPTAVDEKYLDLIAEHAAHPGAGLGPAAIARVATA